MRLSQYFRHLFQLVNFIDEKSILSYNEKYQYIKLLRAQLSNQEQVILAFNVLSNIGSVWENDKLDDNKKLITKYNLIKNIPEGFTQSIDIKAYFPKVTFEGEGKTQERINLEESYY